MSGYFDTVMGGLEKTFIMCEMEVRKLSHDRTELYTRAVQPALWLIIFGNVMSRYRLIPTGSYSYMEYITPGILAQSIMFISIFYGITIVWERDLGLLSKLLVAPIPRPAIVSGKALSSSVRAFFQAAIVLVLALLLGVRIILNPIYLLLTLPVIVVSSTCFAGLSILVASFMKTRERFMGIGQLITMPLFFASNALYPVEAMPQWLQVISAVNPMSYMVDALRSLLITGAVQNLPLDFFGMLIALSIFITLASVMFRKILE
jgi:ABC-2 type transport system permease protein